MRAGHSPTPDEAQPLIERACTKLVSQMIKSDIEGFATTLGGHEGKDSPLMKAVEQRARERGIELDVEPGDLGKLARKFEGELTKSCLLDKDNLHPAHAQGGAGRAGQGRGQVPGRPGRSGRGKGP